MNTRVLVFRFDHVCTLNAEFQEYEIPYTDGMTVLDALRYIQASFDTSFAFRWECSKGTCGTCGVMLNGKPVLSCHTHLDEDTIAVISPLSNFLVHKDLVVDLAASLERLNLTKPYLVPGDQNIQSKFQADASRLLRSCIECWICASVCPIVRDHNDVADPVGMVRLARYHLDVRDDLDRRSMARELGVELYNCKDCQLCVNLCPKGINIPVDAIDVLLRGNEENES